MQNAFRRRAVCAALAVALVAGGAVAMPGSRAIAVSGGTAVSAEISARAGADADMLTLSVMAAEGADPVLSEACSSESSRIASIYALELARVEQGKSKAVTSDFGTLTLTLPVPSQYRTSQVNVYWLDGSGGLAAKRNLAASSGEVSVEITDYSVSASGGNVVLAGQVAQVELDRTNYLSKLDEAFSAYHTGDYTETGFQDLTYAYENGVVAVRAAVDAAGVKDAYDAAIAAMAAVPKDDSTEVALAKAEALQRLAECYSGFSMSNYTESGWSIIESEYSSAKKAVTAAASAADATSAASAGVKAMNSVKPDVSGSSGDLSGSGSSGLSSSGSSGLSSGSGSSGLASGRGSSGLSGKSGSSGLSAKAASAADRLGVTLESVTNELMEEKGLSADFGVYVSAVEEGGAGETAGLRAGDVITKADGVDVTSVSDLDQALADKSEGDVVELTVERDGEVLTLSVTLGAAASDGDPSGLAGGKNGGLGGGSNDAEILGSDDVGTEVTANALEDQAQGSFAAALASVLASIAVVIGLILFMLRRRNEGLVDAEDTAFYDDADDSPDSPDGPGQAGGLTPAIQF